jgi:MFS family permease
MANRAAARGRWAGLAACGGLFLVVNIHRFAIGTLAGSLMAEFGATAVQMGGLASLYFYLYGIMQIPSGILADTWGPRRSLFLSGLLLAAGAAVSAWASTLPSAFAGRTLIGLGAAAVFVNAMRFCATWFEPWRFATMVGLVNATGYAGAFLAGAPLAGAADALGWRGAFWGIGALTIAAAAASWLSVRDRPPGTGFPVPRITLRGALRATGVALRNREIRKALLTKMGLDSSNFVFFALWGVPYLSQVYELPRGAASRFISIANLGFALGAPCMGFLSDRVFRSRRIPILLAGSGYGLLWIAILFPPGGPHGPILFGVLVFFLGFLAPSLLLTLAVARDVAPPEAAGVATALVNAGGFLGAAVFQLVASAMLDYFWEGQMAGGVRLYPLAGFRAAFIVCVAIIAVSLIAAYHIRESPRSGR